MAILGLLLAVGTLLQPIQHVAPEELLRREAVVRVVVPMPSAQLTPVLWVRGEGEPRFRALALEDDGDRGFSALLPASLCQGRAVEYFVEAHLADGTVARLGDSLEFFRVPLVDELAASRSPRYLPLRVVLPAGADCSACKSRPVAQAVPAPAARATIAQGKPWVPWTTGAAAVASLAAGVALHLSGSADTRALAESPHTGAQIDRTLSSARTKSTAGSVLYGAAAALALASLASLTLRF